MNVMMIARCCDEAFHGRDCVREMNRDDCYANSVLLVDVMRVRYHHLPVLAEDALFDRT